MKLSLKWNPAWLLRVGQAHGQQTQGINSPDSQNHSKEKNVRTIGKDSQCSWQASNFQAFFLILNQFITLCFHIYFHPKCISLSLVYFSSETNKNVKFQIEFVVHLHCPLKKLMSLINTHSLNISKPFRLSSKMELLPQIMCVIKFYRRSKLEKIVLSCAEVFIFFYFIFGQAMRV